MIKRQKSSFLLVVIFLLLHLILVTIGQGIDSGVVEEGLVTIAPGESLGADAQMLVGDKRGSAERERMKTWNE